MTIKRKTRFYWASITGADPEPVEVCTVEGRRACYTLGCADPFFLDEKECPVRLGDAYWPANRISETMVLRFKGAKPIARPKLPRKTDREYKEPPAAPPMISHHGWRGPR